LVLIVREPSDDEEFSGLPELVVGGLAHADAQEVLASAIGGPMDERVRRASGSRLMPPLRRRPRG
jgi:hypothetical protein